MRQPGTFLLRSRFRVLVATLSVYLLLLVVEGALTGRQPQWVDFANPFFELRINNLEEFIESR